MRLHIHHSCAEMEFYEILLMPISIFDFRKNVQELKTVDDSLYRPGRAINLIFRKVVEKQVFILTIHLTNLK